jgi:hypothetical protein
MNNDQCLNPHSHHRHHHHHHTLYINIIYQHPSHDLLVSTSTAHAAVQVAGTAHVALFSPQHLAAPVAHFDTRALVPYGATGLGPVFYMGVFVGYLIADHAWLGRIDSALMAAHHLGASAAWTGAAWLGSLQWYASFLQFNELSTVFVNLRQVLFKSGYAAESAAVKVTSLAMFIAFGIVRIVPLPRIVWQWATRDFAVMRGKDGATAAWCFSGFFAFHVCMQSFWFGLMVKKFVRVLLGAGGRGKKGEPKKKK